MPSSIHALGEPVTPHVMPDGVELHPLQTHVDTRGALTEIYRESWKMLDAVQWNLVHSHENVLRGVHCHLNHRDVLIAAAGEVLVGLHDLRPGSRTHGCSTMVVLSSATMEALVTPPGVAHGFYLQSPTTLIYGVDHYWNLDDELGCRFDDPMLGMDWPCSTPVLSPRDELAGTFADMRDEWLHRTRIAAESIPASTRAR